MLNEMLKIAAPAVLKAKNKLFATRVNKSCKGQAEPFDILNKSLKIDLRGLTVSRTEKAA